MREQSGVPTTFRRTHNPDVSTEVASRHGVGTSSGLHPEDRPYLTNRHPVFNDAEDDDDNAALYTTRLPTSTRRYAPAMTPSPTVMRVTRHQGPPPSILRASRTKAQVPADSEPEQVAFPQQRWQMHPSVSIGLAMLVMLIGWILFSSLSQWWQFQHDTWTYGYPRTYQIDADVRHGGISHFTVENLDGHILITEVQMSNLAHAHIYEGPIFSGAGADQQPATLSFADVNGDGYPDLILAVGAGRYVLINTHTGFRPSTPTDTITGKGV